MPARPSVLLSHPGTQQVYETAAGLQRAGMLNRFYASVYRRGDVDSSWRWLPPPARTRVVAGLRKRWHPDIDPANVECIGLPFVAMRATAIGLRSARLDRYAAIERIGDAWFDARVASRLRYMHGVTQVHSFEGTALRTFERAHRLGVPTILDAPAAHEYNIRLCDEEARASGDRPEPRFGSPTRIVEERALADVVVAPSAFVRRCLVEHGVPDRKIVTIPFGADTDVFSPPVQRRDHGVFRVLYVASINRRKGTRYLLEAWRDLALPHAELVLAGAPDDYGRDLLRQHAGEYRHIGHVPWFDLPDLFRSADAFVLPSLAEGSALVTYMAMASGLPVIVTEDAGAVARDGVEGIVIPSRDVDGLTQAILRLHSDHAERLRLGAAGRRLIERRYTWAHYHRRIAALHNAVLAGADPVAAVEAAGDDQTIDAQPRLAVAV